MTWLASQLGENALERPAHDLPAHPVERGEPFPEPDANAYAQLEVWFANGDEALRRAREGEGWSPVRCWPHHFDVATLCALDAGSDPEKARSVGVGLSPGDGSYDEPYFYVSPWPPPNEAPTEPLGHGGAWHTEGWIGAVLVARDIGGDQAEQVSAFLESAIGAATRALGD